LPILAEELCKAKQRLKVFDHESTTALKAGAAPHQGWIRSLGITGKALQATAGAAGAVASVVGAVASFGLGIALALGSVAAGAPVMSATVVDLLQIARRPR
jgi:hypothetical protein